jgi:O-antigen ligase
MINKSQAEVISVFIKNNESTIDDIGMYFLLLTVLAIPLSIFLTECFFVAYLIVFFTIARYKFITFNLLNYTVFILILMGVISLYLHPSRHAFFDFKQQMYLALVPFISAYAWSVKRYVLMLRFFIIGMLINLFFGIAEAFNVDVINTQGQGNLGLINFHIYSSMLLGISILIVIYDFFYRRIISDFIFRVLLVFGFGWQLFTTMGRTGQGLLFLLVPLIIIWNAKRYKYIFSLLAAVAVSVLLLSTKAMHMWVKAYSQIHSLLTYGYQDNDIGLRYLFTKAGVIMFLSHPLFGVGIGGFREHFYTLIKTHEIHDIPSNLHYLVGPTSSYVAYISEFGLIGFLSFLLLIFASYKNVMNTPYKNVRQIGILFLLWFFIGSFADTVIWREIIVVPFLIFMSAIPSIKQEL